MSHKARPQRRTPCSSVERRCRTRLSTLPACASLSTRNSAKATTGATRWRPRCSTSTTTATPSSAATARVAPEPRGKARLAIGNCPEYAIIDRRGHCMRTTRQRPVATGRPTSTTPTRRTTANAHAIWDELRDVGCPVAHSDRYGGMWAPLTHELVHEVAYDTDHFTSNGVIVSNARPGIARPCRAGTADHQRPTVPPDRPALAVAAVLAQVDRPVGARGASPV